MIEVIEGQRPSHGVRDMYLLHDYARPRIHSNLHKFLRSKGMKTIVFDSTPCDYWLFNYIKDRLDDEINAETLARFITNILWNIPDSEHCKTVRKYIERLELCILAEGDTSNIL